MPYRFVGFDGFQETQQSVLVKATIGQVEYLGGFTNSCADYLLVFIRQFKLNHYLTDSLIRCYNTFARAQEIPRRKGIIFWRSGYLEGRCKNLCLWDLAYDGFECKRGLPWAPSIWDRN